MKKLILSIGLVAALAAPAMAQSTYDDSAASIADGNNSGVSQSVDPQEPAMGVDNTTTNSILRNDPVNNPSIQRGDQGEYFGANGR